MQRHAPGRPPAAPAIWPGLPVRDSRRTPAGRRRAAARCRSAGHGLRDGDQRHRIGRAASESGAMIDAGADGGETACRVGDFGFGHGAPIGGAMPFRQARSLPSVFLMTDERMGDGLWAALERLPRGAGVVFRHYRLSRRLIGGRCSSGCGGWRDGAGWCCCSPDRSGWRCRMAGGRRAWPLPSPAQRAAVAAHGVRRTIGASGLPPAGAAATLSSSRRSVPHAPIPVPKALGTVRTGLLLGIGSTKSRGARRNDGGVRARTLRSLGITRWAAIDAWLETDG